VRILTTKTLISPRFAERLRQACDDHPSCPPLHQGRQTWLRDELGAVGLKVSVESIRKWLSGEGRPKQEKCEALARLLNVDASWLYMGSHENVENQSKPLKLNLKPSPDAEAVLPVAIRTGSVVQIVGLPFDLTRSEAQKLANIILAHAMPDV
jgi:transcriptional regulator with XRE-family HTH domain